MYNALSVVIRISAILSLLFLGAAVAEANTVQFTQSNFDVAPGETFTVDLVGTDFLSGPDGAAFALSWDPAVLSYVSTTVANPPWDIPSVSDGTAAAGNIEYVFLSKTAGDAGSDFSLASFTFQVLGGAGATSPLSLSNDPYDVGFVAPGGQSLTVSYVNSDVHVVPVPAAIWLFGSALAGMGLVRRRITG